MPINSHLAKQTFEIWTWMSNFNIYIYKYLSLHYIFIPAEGSDEEPEILEGNGGIYGKSVELSMKF